MKTAAKIVLDTRSVLKTGKHPIKIRVMFLREKSKPDYIYLSTGEEMFKDEFDKLYTSKALASRLDSLNKLLSKANKIIEQKPFISKDDFRYQFNEKGNYESVEGLFDVLMSKAEANEQVGTAALLKTTKNSLISFAKDTLSRSTLSLGEITVEFLENYEEWLLKDKEIDDIKIKGISYSTIGIYTRYIRELFNWAIDDLQIIQRSQYPFGRRKFVPPAAVGKKIALNEQQKNLLLNYFSEDTEKQKAVDLWKLSYFCFGLNFGDIIRLRWANIGDEMGTKVIRVYRAKTFGRKRLKRMIEIPVTPEIDAILIKYGSKTLDPNAYIFNVFVDGLTPKQEFNRKHDFIRDINAALKDVSSDLGLPKVTTYVARHTFAYIMKIKGVNIALTQELMDHEDQRTTANYGGGFSIQSKLGVAKLLVS